MSDVSQKEFDTEIDLAFAAVDGMIDDGEISITDVVGMFPQGQISSRYREEE